MSNINVNEELNFMVDQFKEIALRVGNRNCVMMTQIAQLWFINWKKDVLARQLEKTKGQLLKQVQKQELEQHKKHMEKNVLELTTHNESLIKERQQSIMKFF